METTQNKSQSINNDKRLEIMESNRLIAEFMEFPTQVDLVDDRTLAYYVGESIMNTDNTENENDNDVFHPDDMLFNTSWNWLTPVINKCYKEHNRDAYFIQHNKHLLDAINNQDINKAYKIILEFIKSL